MKATLKKLRQKQDVLRVCAKHVSSLDIHEHIRIANEIEAIQKQVSAIKRTQRLAA